MNYSSRRHSPCSSNYSLPYMISSPMISSPMISPPRVHYKSPQVATFMILHERKRKIHCAQNPSKAKQNPSNVMGFKLGPFWELIRSVLKLSLKRVPSVATSTATSVDIHTLIEKLDTKQYKGTKEECTNSIYRYLCLVQDHCECNEEQNGDLTDYLFDAFLWLPSLFE